MRIRHYLREGTIFAYRQIETAYARRRPTFRRWRTAAYAGADVVATRAGTAAMAHGRRWLLRPHRTEQIAVPQPLRSGGRTFDVVDDLVDYTHLPRPRVVELIQRRHESFRSEWHALPGALRDDHWYYLSSRLYLFANAIHLHEDATTLAAIETIAAPGARVLDFGGGTGNLALALAAADRQVAYVELSALQKDFLRFRLAKHGLTEAVEVVDWWANPPAARYDVVIALDVLEHLPDVAETLTTRLLPALRRGGALLEASPFVRNISNPMHHEDGAVLEETLAAYGAVQERETAGLRIWRLPGGDHGEDVTAEPSRVDGAQRREKPL